MGQRILNLTNKKSPYAFSCQLPLNLGDNYIRINAEDKYGNTTESTQKVDDNANLREILTNSIYSSLFYVKMVRTGKTTPDININLNNDIDVNVWYSSNTMTIIDSYGCGKRQQRSFKYHL